MSDCKNCKPGCRAVLVLNHRLVYHDGGEKPMPGLKDTEASIKMIGSICQCGCRKPEMKK